VPFFKGLAEGGRKKWNLGPNRAARTPHELPAEIFNQKCCQSVKRARTPEEIAVSGGYQEELGNPHRSAAADISRRKDGKEKLKPFQAVH
jgi:hypothetical protein